MQTKNLDFPLSLKSLNTEGDFSGYASVFNVIDGHNDIIVEGAFQRNLQKNTDVKLLWQHHMDEPIGVITHMQEDAKGLYIEGKLLLDIKRANEAHSLLKSGAIEGLSIGYSVVESSFDDKTGVRLLSDIDLWEISLVTFPANEHAGITSIKSMSPPKTIREFEHFLRDTGFSRKQAKSIATAGFNNNLSSKDLDSSHCDDEFSQLNEALNRAIGVLQ